MTETDEAVHLQYLLPDGSLKWEKIFGKTYLSQCYISDNGESVTFTREHGNENYLIENYAFDSQGNLLFEKKQYESYLRPSPDGNYFYFKYQYAERTNSTSVEIFDITGNFIGNLMKNMKLFDNSVKFLEKDIVLLYYTISDNTAGNFALCKIENNELVIIWEISLDTPLRIYPGMMESLIYYENRYLCFGSIPYKVYNLDGEELFDLRNIPPQTTFYCSFIDKNTIILLSSKDKSAKILDMTKGKVIDSFSWQLDEYHSPESARFHNNNFILGNYGKTLFIERSTETFYKLDSKLLSNLNNNQLILVKREENALISILRK
ncbi:MAG: hypothetical protein PHR06_13525 [Candidatus Cloacimonetes bacterium]|nr:hypothetical protein [Candidatus Cloacimonadota bacterium]